MYMYLAVTEHAVSVVLIRVQDNVQRLVYYVNKTLGGLRNPLSAIREDGFGRSTCYKETTASLPGPYSACVDRASPKILIEDVSVRDRT